MAHNVETMAFAGQTPWHGLGKPVSPDLSSSEMLKEAGLDWTVSLRSLSYRFKEKTIVEPAMKCLIRNSDGKRLSTVSHNWNPIQNEEAFSVFDSFVKAGEIKMETAGSLEDKNGHTRVWGLARVEDSFEAVKNDVVQSYFLFTNPHIYGQSANLRFTPIRVVCQNTLQLALNVGAKNNKQVSINHRKKFDAEAVKTLLGISHLQLGTYKEQSKFLASKRYNIETLDEYFNQVFPRTSDAKNSNAPSIMAIEARDVIQSQPGADFAAGSWWQAFNAVTFIKDHMQGKSQETRLNKNWYGNGVDEKTEALQLALKMAA